MDRLKNIRKQIPFLIQTVFGFALIIWILTQVNATEVFRYIARLRLTSLCWIFLFFAVSLCIHFYQWKYLLRRNSSNFGEHLLLPSFLVGFALSMSMPGGHLEGGKLFLLGGNMRGKTIAFVIEKTSHGFLKIALLSLVVPISFPKYRVPCMIVLGVLFLMYLFVPGLKRLKALQERNANLHWVFAKVTGYSFLSFLLLMGQYYVLLNETTPISLVATGICVVYVYSVSVLPLGVLGIGISQGVAIYFLAKHGVSAEHTIAISLFLFTVNGVLPALFGAYMLSKHHIHFGEIRRIAYLGYKMLRKETICSSKPG